MKEGVCMEKNKLLSALSYEELKELLQQNNFLRDEIYKYAMDCIGLEISDIARYLDKVKSIRYELGNACYGDYIKIHTEYYDQFLSACENLQKDYCIFPESFNFNKFERMQAKFDFYYDCVVGYQDISDKQFELLEKWFESGIQEIIDMILDYVDGLQDYSELDYLECYVDSYGGEYETDGRYIYETQVRKYA